MREAGGRYVALDGRLWKTLGALLFRPGLLTREYFAGRRRRYIRPARLFLVASLLLFAVLRVVVELGDFDVVQLDPPDNPTASAKDTKSPAAKNSAPAKSDLSNAPAKDEHSSGGLQIDDDFNFDTGGIEIPSIKKRLEYFKHLSTRDKQMQITDGTLRYGPYAMFVLLPAFALLLKLLYLGRGRRYPQRPRLYSEHIVFAAHNHAFLFVGIVAATLVTVGILRAAVIVWMLIYMLSSLRVVYRGSWLGIAVRSGVMFIAYMILFALVTAGLVLAAVLLR